MQTPEFHLLQNPAVFTLDPKSVLDLVKAVRQDVLDTIAEMARKYNSLEFLEFADKIEALKSLP